MEPALGEQVVRNRPHLPGGAPHTVVSIVERATPRTLGHRAQPQPLGTIGGKQFTAGPARHPTFRSVGWASGSGSCTDPRPGPDRRGEPMSEH